MEVIYSLIPGMMFFGLVFFFILMWAVKTGQFQDLEGDSQRIFFDDADETPKTRNSTGKGAEQ
jgi:cbb3-type cytochrome oxidase maturation protein